MAFVLFVIATYVLVYGLSWALTTAGSARHRRGPGDGGREAPSECSGASASDRYGKRAPRLIGMAVADARLGSDERTRRVEGAMTAGRLDDLAALEVDLPTDAARWN